MRSLFSENKDEFYQTLNEYSIKGLRKFSINKYVSNNSINPTTNLWKRVNRQYILRLLSLFYKTKDAFYRILNKYSINGLKKFR